MGNLYVRATSALVRSAVTMRWEYPEGRPVLVGAWCDLCRQEVSDDGLEGHASDCVISELIAKASSTDRVADLATLVGAAEVLLDRLAGLEIRDEEFAREWFGHVVPAIADLRAAATGRAVPLNPAAGSPPRGASSCA